MASSSSAHRAVTAGLSGGLGVALPLVAVAATLPFADAHELVCAGALPFAVGALAGVGLFVAADHLLTRREERLAAEADEVASFTSVFSGVDVSMSNAPTMAEEAATHPSRTAHTHPATPKGVPVIARAADALDEAAAWAEIDAMLNDGSPISCDPLRSKDIYEIALEELRRTEHAAATAVQPAAQPAAESVAATAAPQPTMQPTAAAYHVSPDSTDVFLAIAAGRPNAEQPAASSAPAAVTASIPEVDVDEVEDTSARAAALASLYGSDAGGVSVPGSAAPAPAIPSVYAIPMADYTGHEPMWAAAIAILDEEPVASVAAPASGVPSQTSYVAPDRMALVAEGGNATHAHAHVNSLLEEEFDKVPSKSVRRMSHEFLQVIQGGTASMPRLQAQA